MRVCFPTTYIPQQSGIATYVTKVLSARSMSDEPQNSVNAELWAQQSCNRALDIGPTFERADNYVSQMIRRAHELFADVVNRSLQPLP